MSVVRETLGPSHRPRLQEPTGAWRVVESAGRPFPFPGCSGGYPGRSNGYALVFSALSSLQSRAPKRKYFRISAIWAIASATGKHSQSLAPRIAPWRIKANHFPMPTSNRETSRWQLLPSDSSCVSLMQAAKVTSTRRLRLLFNGGPTLSLLETMYFSLIGVSRSWRWRRASNWSCTARGRRKGA
jgi:hypothetical protein